MAYAHRSNIRILSATITHGCSRLRTGGLKADIGSTALHREPMRPLVPVSLRDLAHQLGPIHLDCFIDLAGLGSSVVFENLDHKSSRSLTG